MAITAEQFKNKACRDILIPGFDVEDEPIEIRIRALSIVGLMGRKAIPNPLMEVVQKLFKLGGNITEQEQESIATENVEGLVEFLTFICEKVMVQPTYEEVGEYLTQEQMMSIFNSIQGTVNQVKSFRN